MFKTCPITQGINMAALSDERQEAIYDRADDLMCRAEASDLIPLIDDVIGGKKGADILLQLAIAIKTFGNDRRFALNEMIKIIEDEVKNEFVPAATAQIDAGLDAWGDAE